jgi:hypothetical protein
MAGETSARVRGNVGLTFVGVSMLLALLLLALPAHAEKLEVGESRKLGFGIAAGYPPTGSVKYHFDRRRALAVHAGPTLTTNGLHTRVQYEGWAFDLKSWTFGVLGLTWHAGVVVNLVFGQAVERDPVRPGVVGGVGVELRLVPVPVAAFAEVGPTLFPLDFLPNARFLPYGIDAVVGARWYFGKRKRPLSEGEGSLPPPETAEARWRP